MTSQEIENLSYTDFVGLINQWNVLPGSFDTLNRWRVFGSVDKDSSILEIACTTGFSSREISLLTGAQCHGIDISAASVKSAIENKERYAPQARLTYEAGDALSFSPPKKYSHVIIGASLKFFSDPQTFIAKIKDLLVDDGILLASPFYTTREVPLALVERARSIFNITITTESYKEILTAYKDFEILYEERKLPLEETPEELAHYCASTINLFRQGTAFPEETYVAAYERLLRIKQMSNDLRPFQGYSVLVLRARKELFGKRLVELF